MCEVTGDENVARLAAKPVGDPLRGIVRLEIARRGELCERIARAPERFGRLFRAQLAAVPHDRWLDAALHCYCREPFDRRAAGLRQRTANVYFRSDRLAVMNEIQVHFG